MLIFCFQITVGPVLGSVEGKVIAAFVLFTLMFVVAVIQFIYWCAKGHYGD